MRGLSAAGLGQRCIDPLLYSSDPVQIPEFGYVAIQYESSFFLNIIIIIIIIIVVVVVGIMCKVRLHEAVNHTAHYYPNSENMQKCISI